MRELQIIVKCPDDGNPLNQKKGVNPTEGMISVGYKFRDEAGNWYGDYILLSCGVGRETISEAIGLMLKQAYSTEDELI